mgnify:CR=1 FL=1
MLVQAHPSTQASEPADMHPRAIAPPVPQQYCVPQVEHFPALLWQLEAQAPGARRPVHNFAELKIGARLESIAVSDLVEAYGAW